MFGNSDAKKAMQSKITSPFYQTSSKQMSSYSPSTKFKFYFNSLNAEEKEVHSERELWRQIHSMASIRLN